VTEGKVKNFIISETLANATLQYLGKRPYVEVAALVAGLMQLKEVPPPEPKPEE
jgi:hypothetical protein